MSELDCLSLLVPDLLTPSNWKKNKKLKVENCLFGILEVELFLFLIEHVEIAAVKLKMLNKLAFELFDYSILI